MGPSPLSPLRVRGTLLGLLPLLNVLSAVFVGWRAISLLCGTPFPVMVVTTESMEPAFQPGDVLLMANHHGPVHVGDLPVCWLSNRQFPMIHRIIQVVNQDHEDPGKRQLILTKGDNNEIDDALMYPDPEYGYIHRDEIIGFVRAYIPLLGWPTILLQDYRRIADLNKRLFGERHELYD